MKFKIVVPSYNSVPWIEETLKSIEAQVFRDFDVCVIDDASTDPRQKEIIQKYCERNGWLGIYNEENIKQVRNVIAGIKALEPEDDDVVMVLDGDDWFFNEYVLEKLAKIYEDEEVWLTYGQFVEWKTGKIAGCKVPPFWRRFFRAYRRWDEWVFSQLRTFRYFLWKNLKDESLRGPDGNYFRAGWDLAAMLPLVEMAGSHAQHVSDILYVYNDVNPINDFRIRFDEQRKAEKVIRRMKKYPRLKAAAR